MILEGEIKDAKMSSFSSDFQTLIKHLFPLWIINKFEKSNWSIILHTEKVFSGLPEYQNVNCREIVNNLIEDQPRDLALNRAELSYQLS